MDKQANIERMYERVLGELKIREKKLADRLKMSRLVSQAASLNNWLGTKAS